MSVRIPLILSLCWLSASPLMADDEPAPKDDAAVEPGLTLSEPIACRNIKGYEDYEPLDEPELTKDEKLFIYLRPFDHTIEDAEDGKFHVHLAEDVNIHRKGQKRVLWGKKNIIDYDKTVDYPPRNLYLGSIVSLKELPVGEYTAEIFVHDQLKKNETKIAKLDFRVVKAVAPRP
ncbi:MAG TPA: hypothetical protein VFT74_01415 [Isosphaeraceae bacterium]|nr:hypothetical protein [Isosphaeraceae bacterium]